jgi:hypothetical protein
MEAESSQGLNFKQFQTFRRSFALEVFTQFSFSAFLYETAGHLQHHSIGKLKDPHRKLAVYQTLRKEILEW